MGDSKSILAASAAWPLRSDVSPLVVAAAATEQPFTVNTIDDFRDRRLVGAYVDSVQTRVIFRLYSQGQKFVEAILAQFADGNDMFRFDVGIPAQQLVTVSFQDPAGTGIANVNVVLFYRPDPSQGM